MSGLVNVTGAVSGVVGTSVGTPAGGVEADTVMVFHQSAAPTGWTKLTATGTGDTAINDVSIRCVTGNITDGVGGTVAMTTAFASQAVASHVVAINEMPSHTHTFGVCCVKASDGIVGDRYDCDNTIARATAACGGGAGHTHTAIDLAVKYVDVIVASKD